MDTLRKLYAEWQRYWLPDTQTLVKIVSFNKEKNITSHILIKQDGTVELNGQHVGTAEVPLIYHLINSKLYVASRVADRITLPRPYNRSSGQIISGPFYKHEIHRVEYGDSLNPQPYDEITTVTPEGEVQIHAEHSMPVHICEFISDIKNIVNTFVEATRV